MGDSHSADRVWVVFPDKGRHMEFQSLNLKLPGTPDKLALRLLGCLFTDGELEVSNVSFAPMRKILSPGKVERIRSKL